MLWIKSHSKKIMMAILMAGLIFIALHCGPGLLSAQSEAYIKSDGFYLPIGDVDEGRKAFTKFKCHTCHSVYFDRSLPQPVVEKLAPVLGDPRRLHMPGEFADAIVSPSRHIVPGFELKDQKQSRMGKFSQVMTVQELVDIVAYLMAQEE